MSITVFYNYLENTTSREAFYEVLAAQTGSDGVAITRWGKIGSRGQFKEEFGIDAMSSAQRAVNGKQGRHYRPKAIAHKTFTSIPELSATLRDEGVNGETIDRLIAALQGDAPLIKEEAIKTKPPKKAEVAPPPKPASWGSW